MSSELFILVALWCAPLSSGVAKYEKDAPLVSQWNYSRVQDCRIRLRNCLHEGGDFNYQSKLEACLYDKHPEAPAK